MHGMQEPWVRFPSPPPSLTRTFVLQGGPQEGTPGPSGSQSLHLVALQLSTPGHQPLQSPLSTSERSCLCQDLRVGELTKSQVNKAGKALRVWSTGSWAPLTPEASQGLEVLQRWRAAHQYPLIKANNGLRSVVRTEGCQVEVSQRLKSIPTIVDKLVRQPTMQLSTMQDIGGVVQSWAMLTR